MTQGVELCCPHCDRRFSAGTHLQCPSHNGLAPALDLVYDFDILREQFDPATATREDIWRYGPLFPVDRSEPVTMGEGWTDLVGAASLGERLDVDLSLKLEGANPTGSTKDRGSSVLVTYAKEAGHDTVACASTGNAAASVAAYAARASLDCRLFVPEQLPEAKAVQPRMYGADVVAVDGDYSDAYEQCRRQVGENGWLDRSAGSTPYTPAGARTLGYELTEQTTSPEWVVVPMGNGGTITGVWRGWETFTELGYTDRTPRFLGVQADSATAIHDQFQETETADRPDQTTCADSIAVRDPHRAREACRAIEASGGTTVTVTDSAIRGATRDLSRMEGIFAEPASAAVIAGIETARDQRVVDAGEGVVAVITGNGLKDTSTAYQSL